MSQLLRPRFPDASMVSAAASLLHPLAPWDGSEGPRHRLILGPGVVAIRSKDLARLDRTANRRADADARDQLKTNSRALEQGGYAAVFDGAAGDQVDPAPRRGVVAGWSRRSRARMVERLAQLDYSPLYATGEATAMVTLTCPDNWQAVAPDGKTFKKHLQAYRKRFERAWGRPLVAVWKLEFQRRGAPHLHILMTPPTDTLDGETFRQWNARVWVEILDPSGPDRDKMLAFHLGPRVVDFNEGHRASDPRRLAVYFTKHGSFGAKEYQNHAPVSWLHRPDCAPTPDNPVCDGCQSVGRFWGYWHLELATVETEIDSREALAAVRTMRRYARSQAGGRVVLERGPWDPARGLRGEQIRRYVPTGYRVKRLRGSAGFLVVNSGPRFASQLAAYLDQVGGRDVRSVYGRQIAAARLKEKTPALTVKGRGLLLRQGWSADELAGRVSG